jgi:hypothetical protein
VVPTAGPAARVSPHKLPEPPPEDSDRSVVIDEVASRADHASSTWVLTDGAGESSPAFGPHAGRGFEASRVVRQGSAQFPEPMAERPRPAPHAEAGEREPQEAARPVVHPGPSSRRQSHEEADAELKARRSPSSRPQPQVEAEVAPIHVRPRPSSPSESTSEESDVEAERVQVQPSHSQRAVAKPAQDRRLFAVSVFWTVASSLPLSLLSYPPLPRAPCAPPLRPCEPPATHPFDSGPAVVRGPGPPERTGDALRAAAQGAEGPADQNEREGDRKH